MEQWRKHYHDLNKEKEIPHSDMKCYGCGEPYGYNEQIMFINADPYCHEGCFMSKQVIDESWSTCDAPSAEEEAEALIKGFSQEQIEAVRLIADIFNLGLQIHPMNPNSWAGNDNEDNN